MAEIALAGLLICVAAGAGMTVLSLFKLKCNRWENLGLGAALGLGLFSYLIMGIGLVGWLYSGAVWAVIGILFPPAVWGFQSFFKLGGFGLDPLGKWERLGIGILAWCASFNIFIALAPAFLADSLKYHLTAPKWYISLHQIQFAPVFPFNLPQNMEMIFTAGMLLHSDTVGLLVHYSLGIFAALGIFFLAREFLSLNTSIWAAVFFYAGIPFIPHAAQGVDLGPILYTVWAFYAFIRWRNTRIIAWLCLTGVMAGLCAGIKYTGIYTPFALFFLVVWAGLKDHKASVGNHSQAVRALLLFLLFGFVAGCPWYLKNWFMTGNPIYPIFYPLLGGKGWNMTAYVEGFKRLNSDMGLLGRSFFDYMISPLKLIFIQNRVFARGGMGLLTLSFVPAFCLLGKKYLKRYAWWIVFSLPFYAAWVIFSQHGRFLLPLVALWSIPCAAAAFKLIKSGGYLRIIAVVIMILGVGMGAVLAPGYASRFIPVVIGIESRESFLSKTTMFYQDIQWMNSNLPEGSLVMSEFMYMYYLDRENIWMNARSAAWIDYSRIETTEDILIQGIELGVTHIFVMSETRVKEWDDLIAKNLVRRLYYNPKGWMIFSISMGVAVETPVAVYAVH